jgi:O-acetyl-ADP-ribose deacetylase (regulator of RNase III)
MPSKDKIVVDSMVIEVVVGDLLTQPVEAVMISANNWLRGKSSWAGKIKAKAGPAYDAECQELSQSYGPRGISLGRAVVTGGYGLAHGDLRRRIIQAITIAYPGNPRVRATPEILYRATRAGLERAEFYRVSSVATYLMAARFPDYATKPEQVMAEALCRALIDHAASASSVIHAIICEHNAPSDGFDRVSTAVKALKAAYASRYGAGQIPHG